MLGATVIKQVANDNPRKLLVEIIDENRVLDKKAIFDLFSKQVKVSQVMTRAVQWYFFINMYEYHTTSRHSVGGNRPGREMTASQRLEQRIVQDEMVESIKQQLVMLDLVMPNEKLMRDCTGLEVEQFGTRYQRIAQKVGRQNVVGSVLTEDQVREVLCPKLEIAS